MTTAVEIQEVYSSSITYKKKEHSMVSLMPTYCIGPTTIWRNSVRTWLRSKVLFHQNNGSVHYYIVLVEQRFLSKELGYELLPLPLFSLSLAHSDYFLCSNFKKRVGGIRFDSTDLSNKWLFWRPPQIVFFALRNESFLSKNQWFIQNIMDILNNTRTLTVVPIRAMFCLIFILHFYQLRALLIEIFKIF